ncbi:SagB/ThcOx family dehydrogenase [Microaceticoccus formicicus]|uniref:SagB/ThcOx family dehydrogenase n=1 Tax=Microaceticoccus formicicus TaxID=3118105 RepID=UPI003CD004ED|nr:SagB/ThcOx family dehydrogenase [Peptoniphilaceae bacterium AMB_02]
MDKIKLGRRTLKDYDRDIIDFSKTDQSMGVPMPPVQKKVKEDEISIKLPKIEIEKFDDISLNTAIHQRKSVRKYTEEGLSLEELTYLLWASHGVRLIKTGIVLRNAPSAGNRHAIDTYLSIHNVEGIKPGVYRYQPLDNELVLITQHEDLRMRSAMAARGQSFAGNCPVTFFWVAVPYRMEWRYDHASYKVIALDAGHICQNLYLAAEAINSGVCAIAAYNQDYADQLLKLDGEDEFVVYMASLGKK